MSNESSPKDSRDEAIRLDGVRKEYDRTVAVKNLSLTVNAGEIYAFLGPNGAGKTTTIKMITGLVEPTAGDIFVRGIPLQSDPINVRRSLAYVPDQPYLYDKLTGREFLEFTARLYEVPEDQIEDRIATYSELFQMQEYLDDLGETYSHGMKQRVVLSATFLHNPEVVLVDEPLVGLDPESSQLVRTLFRERVEDGLSLFMSTHVLSIAEKVADRIGVISRGELIEEGTLDQLQQRSKKGMKQLEDLYMEITQKANKEGTGV